MPTNTRPHGRWTADAVFLWIVVCGALGLACFRLSRSPASVGAQDFRGLYVAGQMVLRFPKQLFDVGVQKQLQNAAAGGNQLVTFEHPAYEALIYAPLASLGYRTAYLTYAAWNMLLLWLCYRFAPPAASAFGSACRPALFFLGFPLLLAIFVGQNPILFVLAVCLACSAFLEHKDGRAGLILGLVIFKLAIAVPLALLLSIRRGRRFIVGFLGSSLTCAAVSIAITGLAGTRTFLHLLATATLNSDHSVKAQFDQGIWLHAMPNLAGLLYLLGSGHLSPSGFNALNLIGTLAVLGACAWLQRRTISDASAFGAAVSCAVLVSPHLYVYDLAVLPVAFLMVSGRWVKLVAVLWFVMPPVLYAVSFPYLMWFAPAVIIPVLLLVLCFCAPKQSGAALHHSAHPQSVELHAN